MAHWNTLAGFLLGLQGVVFHFDCVRAGLGKQVHLTLSSSPMPLENHEKVEASITFDASMPQSQTRLNIKYEVKGSEVRVEFEPLEAETYLVCLSPLSSDYSSCVQDINTTTSPVIFRGVQKDNYTIMIKPSPPGDEIFASKYFFVPGDPAADKPYIDLTILIIILTCVIFVTMATTIAFCIMRKQGKSLPDCIKRCKEQCQYERTATNIPNNMQKQPIGMEVKAVVLDGEPEAFIEIVNSLMAFLRKWARCDIKDSCLVACHSQEDYEYHIENTAAKKYVIFMSERMVAFLKCHKNGMENSLSPQQRFIVEAFKGLHLKESQKVLVSFEHLDTVFLNHVKVLNLTTGKGKLHPVGLNMEEMQQLLMRVSSVETEQTTSGLESHELNQVLRNIRIYLTNDLGEEGYRCPDLDIGYESQSATEGHGYIDCPTTYKVYHESSGNLPSARQMFDSRGRMEETKQWVESQSQLPPVGGCAFYQPHTQNTVIPHQIEYRKQTGVTIPAQYIGIQNGGCYTNSNTVARLCQRENARKLELGRVQHNLPPDGPEIQWVEPLDDDTESVTFSVIYERQQELNDKYMQNLTSANNVQSA